MNMSIDQKERGVAGLMGRITSRPVSENQTFEPDPAALQQASEQTPQLTDAAANAKLEEAAAKVRDAQPKTEPDVGPTSQTSEEDQATAADEINVDNWESALNEAAIDGKVLETDMRKYVADQVKFLTKRNRADALTETQRTAIVAAIRGGLK
jgi:hypothetical protein